MYEANKERGWRQPAVRVQSGDKICLRAKLVNNYYLTIRGSAAGVVNKM